MFSAVKKPINRIFAGRNFDAKRSYKLIKVAVAVWFVVWSLAALSAIISNPEYNWFGECPLATNPFWQQPIGRIQRMQGVHRMQGLGPSSACLNTKDKARNYLIISVIPLALFWGLRFGAPRVFDYFFPKKNQASFTLETSLVDWSRVAKMVIIAVVIVIFFSLVAIYLFYSET